MLKTRTRIMGCTRLTGSVHRSPHVANKGGRRSLVRGGGAINAALSRMEDKGMAHEEPLKSVWTIAARDRLVLPGSMTLNRLLERRGGA